MSYCMCYCVITSTYGQKNHTSFKIILRDNFSLFKLFFVSLTGLQRAQNKNCKTDDVKVEI